MNHLNVHLVLNTLVKPRRSRRRAQRQNVARAALQRGEIQHQRLNRLNSTKPRNSFWYRVPWTETNTGDCGKQLVPTVKAITVNRNSELSILNQAALESILTIRNNILQSY